MPEDSSKSPGESDEEDFACLASRTNSRTGIPTDVIDGVTLAQSALAVPARGNVASTAAAGSDHFSAGSSATGSAAGLSSAVANLATS